MASEIRVDKINSLSGVGTVTLSPTGVDIAGITTAATLRATTGIVTSLTAGSLTSLGAVSGTTGTFSGAVSGTTGTFSAAVSGTTGTFTGDVDIADKIVHTGDTDTAIRFSAADTIQLETGGTARFTVGGGNVVQQSGTLYVKNATGDSNGLKLSQESGDESRIFNHYSGALTFGTANTERARIDSTGRLLLNTTTEGNAGADDFTIGQISGSTGITIRSGTTNNGNLYFSDGTSGDDEYRGSIQYQHANNSLHIATNAVERVVITSAGNIGVGENSPANLLHVKVSDTGVSPHGSAQIVLERSGTNYLQFLTAADGTSGLVFGDANDNDVGKIVYDHNVTELQFNTETNQRMKITGGGVVQIGGNIANNADIDTSNSKLTIKQSANSQEDGIYIERSGERRGFYIYMGGALGVSDGLCFTTNHLGGDTHILAMDRG